MLPLLLLLNIIFNVCTCVNNEPQDTIDFTEPKDIESVLNKTEQTATTIVNLQKESKLSAEDIEEKYDAVVETIDELTNLLTTPESINNFLNIKGIDRIITLTLKTNDRLKKKVLILIKTLFNVAPTTTAFKIPIKTVDKLLDIFEHDDNLALKAYALDIMYLWLPNNPGVQARVMKMKGLEPFYKQVSKLDASVTYYLLDLFNKILEEHITVRGAALSYDERKLYEKIGLIERMSTPPVCNGLLNIFEIILPFCENNEQFSKLIINLMKNIKPFCLKYYNNKARPLKIFSALKSYFNDKIDLDKVCLNSTEVSMILDDYTKKLNERDEF